MQRTDFRKTWRVAVLTGGATMTASALAQPQGASGHGIGSGMMGGYGGGWMDGYGGVWLPILLVIVVAGLVAWIVTQKRK